MQFMRCGRISAGGCIIGHVTYQVWVLMNSELDLSHSRLRNNLLIQFMNLD